jgi:hypothetical protein
MHACITELGVPILKNPGFHQVSPSFEHHHHPPNLSRSTIDNSCETLEKVLLIGRRSPPPDFCDFSMKKEKQG